MKRISLLVIILFLTLSVFGQTSIPKAQAMFIYNFCRLIEWPSNYKTGPFVIGVIGESPTLDEINNFMTGKRIGTQSVLIKAYTDADQIDKCHILFVPFNKTKNLPQITAAIGSNSTLIIGEKVSSLNTGAIISFNIVANKLKYEIKPSAADSKGIKISSKIKDMAFKVH